MSGPDDRETDRAVWDLEYRAELKSMLRQSFSGDALRDHLLGGFSRNKRKKNGAAIIRFRVKKDSRA